MMRKDNKTDWTNYYQQKKSFFSSFTQRYTLEKILHALDSFMQIQQVDLLELGGGNSCFAKAICEQNRIASYDIVDNNELGVDLFNQKELGGIAHNGKIANLVGKVTPDKYYDFVFSIGLIEHFTKADRDRVIDSHFQFCKDGGIVMISFPTPTLKYRFVRKCMEILGVWQFWDEYPIRYEDVKDVLEEKGIVEKVELNKKLPLSQLIVIIRKNQR